MQPRGPNWAPSLIEGIFRFTAPPHTQSIGAPPPYSLWMRSSLISQPLIAPPLPRFAAPLHRRLADEWALAPAAHGLAVPLGGTLAPALVGLDRGELYRPLDSMSALGSPPGPQGDSIPWDGGTSGAGPGVAGDEMEGDCIQRTMVSIFVPSVVGREVGKGHEKSWRPTNQLSNPLPYPHIPGA